MREHLADGCSPEQIAGRLRRAYPDDMGNHLSVEIIYVGLYVLPCVRRARRVGLGHEGLIAAASAPR